jgi:hypothetical protein
MENIWLATRAGFSHICLPAPAPFGVKKATFWCMAASRPTRKTRKFDVHACFAGMNIKFPDSAGFCGFTALPGDKSPGKTAMPCEQG